MSEALLKTINSKLTHIIGNQQKASETWVKASVITNLTGWDSNKMRTARDNNYISWKKTDTGFWYLLESLNKTFYKMSDASDIY